MFGRKGQSRLKPQHSNWEEDLPARDAPESEPPKLYDDLRSIDDRVLEVSRSSSFLRGVGLLFGVVIGCIFLFLGCFLVGQIVSGLGAPRSNTGLGVVVLIFGTVFFGVPILLCRQDVAIPRDMPVRFDRHARKIHVYEFQRSWSPFAKWPTVIKTFDWDNVHAQIVRYSGVLSGVYITRYALILSSCKPGTLEVVDSFDLKGNIPTTRELAGTWAYVRHYMEHGPAGLPTYKPLPRGVSFRRSFFHPIRFLDPTREGREYRAQMTASDWAFNVPVVALLFWLFIPWGICHYIAMRLSPTPKWPSDIPGGGSPQPDRQSVTLHGGR